MLTDDRVKVDSEETELAWRRTKQQKKRDKSRFVSRLECTGADGTDLNVIEMFDIDLRFRSKLHCLDYIVISWLGFPLYILRERTRLAN